MQGGGEAPRHLAGAVPGGCSGAWTSSGKAHPGQGLSGASVQILPWLPRGPQKFALVSSDLPLSQAGDEGGAVGPLPWPVSPGRLRAGPLAARGLPSPDLTAAATAAARGRSPQLSALRPVSPLSARQRVAVSGLSGLAPGSCSKPG